MSDSVVTSEVDAIMDVAPNKEEKNKSLMANYFSLLKV